ncbi:MAG: tRNA threonylcarbamoyladenosine dehydratase, partial [Duncaniella sp.]|nr:tRNA threonylcarbamoyladenosine dehydratase [Duncaniella sp.]
ARIEAIEGLYTAETADSFPLADFDYVIDAIDSLADKALLIMRATEAMDLTRHSERPVTFFSSMGAALKFDPSRIAVAEFDKVKGCPLAAALRRRFKRSGVWPKRKFQCVFSDELVANIPLPSPSGEDQAMRFGKVAVNGSLMHITAIFGITLASLVIRKIVGKK